VPEPLKAAVFLDRDGTISEEVGYLNHISRFRIFPFASGAIRKLNDRHLPVFVVTNQSGVGRGYFPVSLVNDVHALMTRQLAERGAHLDGIYYCPHLSAENCACRKPGPGMLQQISKEHSIDLKKSFVVGDRYGDIELARGVDARSVLVRTGYGEGDLLYHSAEWKFQPDFIAADLAEAANWIVEQPK
jgi:D-glycero-D-manno-heptose 1,7-bisphosphate phosphatase